MRSSTILSTMGVGNGLSGVKRITVLDVSQPCSSSSSIFKAAPRMTNKEAWAFALRPMLQDTSLDTTAPRGRGGVPLLAIPARREQGDNESVVDESKQDGRGPQRPPAQRDRSRQPLRRAACRRRPDDTADKGVPL